MVMKDARNSLCSKIPLSLSLSLFLSLSVSLSLSLYLSFSVSLSLCITLLSPHSLTPKKQEMEDRASLTTLLTK